MTLEEFETLFVTQAPNSDERRIVFGAFIAWAKAVAGILEVPHKLWIDGGFVTYKETSPSDIDIVVVMKASDFTAEKELRIAPLLTEAESNVRPRVQAMGGYVDAFMAFRGNPDTINYWHQLWGNVKLENGTIHPTAVKGYVEVLRP